MRDYISLTKPRITWLILMSTGVGYFFGIRGLTFSQIHWWALLHTIMGTGLIASGTAALNQWYERAADAKMRRTSDRPLPAGRLNADRSGRRCPNSTKRKEPAIGPSRAAQHEACQTLSL